MNSSIEKNDMPGPLNWSNCQDLLSLPEVAWSKLRELTYLLKNLFRSNPVSLTDHPTNGNPFSKSVSGSMVWEYRENDSKHTGKKVDRDFGFDVNLAIRG